MTVVSTKVAIKNRIPAKLIGGRSLSPILIKSHVEPQIKQSAIQTSIYLFIKRIPVVWASSLREQTGMRYECFDWVVVAPNTLSSGLSLRRIPTFKRYLTQMACIFCFLDDDYQERLRGAAALRAARYEDQLSVFADLFVEDLHFLETSQKCAVHKSLHDRTHEFAIRVREALESFATKDLLIEARECYMLWIRNKHADAIKAMGKSRGVTQIASLRECQRQVYDVQRQTIVRAFSNADRYVPHPLYITATRKQLPV